MDFAKIGSKIYVTQEMVWLGGENMNQWCVLRMEMHIYRKLVYHVGGRDSKDMFPFFFHGDVWNLLSQKMMSQKNSKDIPQHA